MQRVKPKPQIKCGRLNKCHFDEGKLIVALISQCQLIVALLSQTLSDDFWT